MATDYQLDLDQPKKNIFVTQLNDRDDDDINEILVVRESATDLLENVNTQQRTLLLKKEIEADRLSEELEHMRQKFKEQMEKCAQKRLEIQKEQQKKRDYITQMEKFIQENEAKRQREIIKYQKELKLNEEKAKELERLKRKLGSLKRRHEHKIRKIEKYKKYEEYMLKVVERLPPNYLEKRNQKSDMLESLMTRHKILVTTNESVMENILRMEEELEKLRTALEKTYREQNQQKIDINRKLSENLRKFEKLSDRNQEWEARLGMNKIEHRHKWQAMGQTIMSINNLMEKCKGNADTEGITLLGKLDVVQEFIVEKLDMLRIARSLTTVSTPGSSHGPRTARKTKINKDQ